MQGLIQVMNARSIQVSDGTCRSPRGDGRTQMQAWIDFLTTDYGLMSLAVIVFMFVMLSYIGWYVAKHVKEDTERHDRLVREGKIAN